MRCQLVNSQHGLRFGSIHVDKATPKNVKIVKILLWWQQLQHLEPWLSPGGSLDLFWQQCFGGNFCLFLSSSYCAEAYKNVLIQHLKTFYLFRVFMLLWIQISLFFPPHLKVSLSLDIHTKPTNSKWYMHIQVHNGCS